ncbi:MAG: NAD(P)-dependent oxidoreductase [Pontiellaceae bacterium]|nr:NAD(P)-dependent oxidoreductase [Pontiellaceae bacterium]MBN2785643.1 NAD(P)-dependent oxidoreductase [Pontiellaceae bacterium]
MRALITGASGWVGHALVCAWAERHGRDSLQLLLPPEPLHALEAERAKSLETDGFRILYHDLLNPALPVEVIEPFDVLIHLAAHTRTEEKSDAVHVNDRGTHYLLDALRPRLKGKRVLFTGTIACFDRFPPPEGGYRESDAPTPLIPYGKTKLEAEAILKQHAIQSGFSWTILRLPTVYGPGYRPGGLFDLIAAGHPFTRINWPGRLSLLFVDDLATLILELCRTGAATDTCLHVADPEPVAYAELFCKPPAVPLPASSARFIRALIVPLLRRPMLPYPLFISGWRLCHLLGDSMAFNTGCLQQLGLMPITERKEGMRRTYQKEPTA